MRLIHYKYVNVRCLREIYVRMQQPWVVCFAFHGTFPGSFNTSFMLDWLSVNFHVRTSNFER